MYVHSSTQSGSVNVLSSGLGPSDGTTYAYGTTAYFLIRSSITITNAASITAANTYNLPAGFTVT